MSFADRITVLILTYNEAPNIERTLEKLAWASDILLIDSGSTDDTLKIASTYPQVRVVHRPFDNFANQCNFGLEQITSEWVLSLDADYELSSELIEEIRGLDSDDEVCGYKAGFVYRVYGQALRATLYPPRTVLYRKQKAKYHNEGHGHRVSIAGKAVPLRARIYHDDRKPLSRWFNSQQRYARDEADFLLTSAPEALKGVDKIRAKGWPASFLVFFYTLIAKGCIFDGWAGWFYVLQRTLAETMIATEIVDRRLRSRAAGKAQVSRTSDVANSSAQQ